MKKLLFNEEPAQIMPNIVAQFNEKDFTFDYCYWIVLSKNSESEIIVQQKRNLHKSEALDQHITFPVITFLLSSNLLQI